MRFLSSYWFKSSFYTISQRVIVLIFGILSFMLLVRMYTKTEFGVWSLFLIITTGIVETSKLGFLKNTHIKIIHSAGEEERPFVNSASFLINIILSTVLSIVLALFAWFICPLYFNHELVNMLLFYAASSLFLSPLYQLQFMQFVEFDFRAIFFSTVVRQALFTLIILVVFLTDYPMTMLELAVVQFLVVIPALIISYFFSRKYLHFSPVVKMRWISEMFHYGKYTVGTNICNIVFKSMDQLLIGSLTNSANVASYNNALRISNMVEVPALSLAEVMFPKSVQTHQREGMAGVKDMYEKSVAAILCIILPFTCIVILIPEPLILILSGKKYLDVVPIVRITMLYSLILPFNLQFGTIMDSTGMPRTNFILIAITTVLAIIFNCITIPIWGVTGAAFGTLGAYLFNFIVNQIILRKRVGVSLINTLRLVPSFYLLGFNTIKNFKSQVR